MQTNLHPSAHDLFLRHTDKSGRSVIQQHRVWDTSLFLESQEKAAKLEGGSISVVTPEAYEKFRKENKR